MAKYFYKYFYLNKFLFLFLPPRLQKKSFKDECVWKYSIYFFKSFLITKLSCVQAAFFFFEEKWDFYKPLQVKRLTLQNSVTRPAEPLL